MCHRLERELYTQTTALAVLFCPKLLRQIFNYAHDSFKRKQVLNFSHLPGTNFIPTIKSIGQIDPTTSLSQHKRFGFHFTEWLLMELRSKNRY